MSWDKDNGQPPHNANEDMSSTIDEQLSAFVDGELPQEEMELLLRRLERNQSQRETFSRYVTIGAVLRGDINQSDRIRAGVMAEVTALEEPVETESADAQRVVGLRVAGIAAVAGLCGLAVIGVQPSLVGIGGSESPAIAEVAPAQVAEPAQSLVASNRVAADPAPVRNVRTVQYNDNRRVAYSGRSSRMASYLAAHGEHGSTISWRVAQPGFTVQQASLVQY